MIFVNLNEKIFAFFSRNSSSQFHCCGIELGGNPGYTIYRLNNPVFGSNSRRRVPRTCCLNLRDESSVEQCMMEPEKREHTYHDVSLISKFTKVKKC